MNKKILIAGGTGLLGTRLSSLLLDKGYELYILSRQNKSSNKGIKYIQWDPSKMKLDASELKHMDAVINLAGAGIADRRWSRDRKRLIIDSRIMSARCLHRALAELDHKLPIYIGASAVGYYGDRGEEKLNEDSAKGEGFLSAVCAQWEREHLRLEDVVEKTAILRIGIVLSTQGGALREILSKSVGGVYSYFGNGRAYYPWIHIDDVCRMFIDLLEDDAQAGIYNACSDNPLPNKQIIESIARLRKGMGLSIPVPELALKMIMGEMSEVVLSSARVYPERFNERGFKCKFEDLDSALKDLFEKDL